jgi:anti-sigma B factor antagonist
MEIEQRSFHRADLIAVQGRLDAASAPDLQQAIEELFRKGRCRIVLDMEGLDHISSAGLRVLIDARRRAREWKLTDLEGGDVRIASLPPRIKEVFDLTGMTVLFEVFDDVTEAVGSF